MMCLEINTSKLLSLPSEVLELVLSYIPTINLLSYANIPNLDDLLKCELNNRHVKVYLHTRYIGDIIHSEEPKFWDRTPIGDETRLDSRSIPPSEGFDSIEFREPDCVERFLDFRKRHPNLSPELRIHETAVLEKLLREDPWCFQDIRSLNVMESGDPKEQEEFVNAVSSFAYNIDTIRMSNLADCTLPRSVRSLELFNFSEQKYHLRSPSIEYQLKELTILSAIEVEDCKYLPRSLQSLNTDISLDDPRCTLDLPLTLQQLVITFAPWPYVTEIDISKLPSLEKLRLVRFPLEELKGLHAPKQLESLTIMSNTLRALESIEQYTMLKELSVAILRSGAKSVLDCTLPDSLQRFYFDWWTMDESEMVEDQEVEESYRKSSIILPLNLKSLRLTTNSPLLCLKEWIIPWSLRTLSFQVTKLPVGFKIPPNLISLSIICSENGFLPRPLPKSLVRIITTLLPPNKSCLKNLTNLTYLNCQFLEQERIYFDWKLPSSLKRLIVHYNYLETLKLNVPNLKAVELFLRFPNLLEKLELPSSVIDLRIHSVKDNDDAELSISKKHKLPTQLRVINLLHVFMDSESLNNLHLKNFQYLWYINLYKNQIKKVADGMFPASTKVLILSSNFLDEVDPYAFKNLPNLQYLYLSRCDLGLGAVKKQPLEFSTSLKYVQLACNYLRDVDSFHFPSENMTRIGLTFNHFPDNEKIVATLRTRLGDNVVVEV
ncbi:uncharacterized protein J8A68_000817 [[Candida] subhashii]|uniref:F-box domain-containing protein n=1 Tax=[Candida] subhashii TaxID=561895 RepID=A0A8J5URJ2_9ASCO|nr:uncharacterized protein J8A68_000817 [[Candida] subhashii]KAG7665611.1 hypothetical protein J8A68_000817 [[Candida] subhashii]